MNIFYALLLLWVGGVLGQLAVWIHDPFADGFWESVFRSLIWPLHWVIALFCFVDSYCHR